MALMECAGLYSQCCMPLRDGTALKFSNEGCKQVHSQNCWVWALVLRGLAFYLLRTVWFLILGCLIILRVVHLCNAFGPFAFGPCVAANERVSLLLCPLVSHPKQTNKSLGLSAVTLYS